MWWLLPLAEASTFTPVQATKTAADVDLIYSFLIWSSVVSFILLIGGMTYFVVKYRRKSPNDKTAYITHNHTLEFLWSFIPFLIFMFVFAWGWIVYHDMRKMPENALEVQVYGKKWEWRFVYKSGREITATLNAKNQKVAPTVVVPINRPVKFVLASEKINPASTDRIDRPVLHSFFIPAMRIKQDVVPGRYTALWFQADKIGEFNVFCAEYCGDQHSAMMAFVKVVTEEEFDQWLSEGAAGELAGADLGKALYAQKACIGCHSLDGTKVVGPTFKGLFGKTETFEGGATGVADENYLRESILEPNKHIVAGYPAGTMPSFAGQLTEQDINAIIEFIKSVK